jgi:hypothetical protein
MFEKADLIHRYTRVNAYRDVVLIDISAAAQEAGIRYPVALTQAAWERYVMVPPGVLCQDESGRLWNVLSMLRFTAPVLTEPSSWMSDRRAPNYRSAGRRQ